MDEAQQRAHLLSKAVFGESSSEESSGDEGPSRTARAAARSDDSSDAGSISSDSDTASARRAAAARKRSTARERLNKLSKKKKKEKADVAASSASSTGRKRARKPASSSKTAPAAKRSKASGGKSNSKGAASEAAATTGDSVTDADRSFIDDTGADETVDDLYGDDGELRRLDAADEAIEDIGETEFDKTLKQLKTKRGRRNMDSGAVQRQTSSLIARMHQAAADDAEALEAGRPATAKLTMIPDLEAALLKIDLREALVDNGILRVFKIWLEPLPKALLPSINIRTAVLQALHVLPVTTDQVKTSQIGKSVMKLKLHPKETIGNKRLAAALVERWLRPVYGGTGSAYAEFDPAEEARRRAAAAAAEEAPARKLTPAEFAKNTVPKIASSRMHAMIPDAVDLDFTRRPKASADVLERQSAPKRGKNTTHDRFGKRILASGRAAAQQAVTLNVTGSISRD